MTADTTMTMEEIAAAKRGEEHALSRLIQMYQHRVYHYVSRLVPQSADAQEVTQEVLIQMVRSLNGVRSDVALTAWVFRIASNKVADFFRRHVKEKTVGFSSQEGEERDPLLNIPDNNLNPIQELEQEERQQLIEQSFNTLPKIYRSALILRIHENLSDREIAETLDCPLGTIKWRLHQGMVLMGHKLAEALEGRRKS